MNRVEFGGRDGLLLECDLAKTRFERRPILFRRPLSHLFRPILHAWIIEGLRPNLPAEDHRRGGAAADDRGIGTGQSDDAHVVVQFLREHDVCTTVVTRHDDEMDRAFEVDDGTRDLRAVLELNFAQRLR